MSACSIVDAHVHVGLAKYRPVEDLIAVMEQHQVAKAVLVQYGGNDDNSYLGDCLRRFPGRFAAIAIVDVAKPDAPDRLKWWVQDHGLRGLRLSATARSPSPDPYALWAQAEELGIVVSITGNLAQMSSPEMENLIRRFPRLKIRLEHMGWYPDVTEAAPYHSYRRLLRLAVYPNVYMMFSAFYGFSRRPYPYPDTLAFVGLVYEAFGPHRIMWGSDWPPVDRHEGYGNALAMALDVIPYATDEDRSWVLGKTAESLWQF